VEMLLGLNGSNSDCAGDMYMQLPGLDDVSCFPPVAGNIEYPLSPLAPWAWPDNITSDGSKPSRSVFSMSFFFFSNLLSSLVSWFCFLIFFLFYFIYFLFLVIHSPL
jgi:hypothetical protein